MNQKWNKETVIALFYYDLPQLQQTQITYLYDKLELPHVVNLTYEKSDIRSSCKLSEPLFRSIIMKLNIPYKDNYSINEAYTIVSTIRRMGVKKINAKKSRIYRGKEAFAKTDNNTQNGTT
jgi:hypothetical protein